VRAVILDKSELYLISESAGMEKVRKELSAIYTATRETDVSTKAEDINVQKEPFTILLSTSQDSVDSMAYRSDLNLLLTINPKTRTIYTVVVPRSVWAEYACDSELACPAGQEDKVGFASLYSQEGLKATIEKLLDTKIDFTMRIDLQEMITMLDLDQTVTITTEDGDVAMTYPKLLQYIGSQNDYSSANTSQENREMNVLSALYTQLDLNSVSRLKSYASILASSIHTSASYNQLASLVKMLFMENGSWTTYQTEITGEIDTRYSIALTEYGYALIPYEDILEQTRKAIADVLSGSTPDLSIVRETELETQTDDSENQEDSEYDANGENEDEDENSDEYTDDQDTWSDDSDYNSANDSYNSYDQSYGSNDYGSNSYGNSSGSWQSGQSGSGSNQNGYSNNSNNGYSNGYDYSSSYDEDEYDDDDDGYGNWSSRP
jgi:anionic cell wall polymer biosynthesis LytR-Cps2A-Psr (LCP) family protein